MKLFKFLIVSLFFLSFGITGCNSPSGESETAKLPDIANTDPSNPPVERNYATQVMLFNGTGISTSDWQSTESILKKNSFTYQLVNSAQLNAMSEDDIAEFGTLVFPGGYGNQITNGLTAQTRINVRNAVRDRGVGYVGFCAGAWTAVGPEPATGQAASYGFALVTGPGLLDEYLSLWNYEPTAAMVTVTLSPSGNKRQMIWVGGPITPEWSDGVIGRYSTGEPAISQTFAGKGLVLISGPHPEAPSTWPPGYGLTDSDGVDHDIAVAMFRAAISGQKITSL